MLPVPVISHLPGPWMRSAQVVRINIVLAPKSHSVLVVAAVVERFPPLSNFPDTATLGFETASSYLLCAWDLYTCSVAKLLMRPLLSYSGFWRNMKTHYPESMTDICFPAPSWSHLPASRCWGKDVSLREKIGIQEGRVTFLAKPVEAIELSRTVSVWPFFPKDPAHKETQYVNLF